MSGTIDLEKDFLPLCDVLAGATLNKNVLITGDAADVDEVRQTLEQLTLSLRALDDGAAAFTQSVVDSHVSGSNSSLYPGVNPMGPVEAQKRKSKSTAARTTPKKSKSRENYPKDKSDVLMQWLEANYADPYPDEPTRDRFSAQLGLVSSATAS